MRQLESVLSGSENILPEIFLATGLLVLVLVVSFQKSNLSTVFYLAICINIIYIIFASKFYLSTLTKGESIFLFEKMLTIDLSSLLFKQLIHIAALIFFIHSRILKYEYRGEIYLLILAICLGLDIMVMSQHFVIIFLALEFSSILSYVLVASDQKKINFEAAFKYLIFGSTSSAIMLLGISFIYGISYSLNFSDSALAIALQKQGLVLPQILLFFVMAGVLFKVAAAPFHSWVPDVYQTTSTPILSFLSFAPKLAGFVVIGQFIKVLEIDLDWVIGIIAILSMTVGNLAALYQKNLKRMLGFSGIAHVGFILTGLLLYKQNQHYGTYFYLISYLPITMGSFYLADVLNKYKNSYTIEDYKGLGQNFPSLGLNALIIMAALVGLPPTIGFLAKIMVFSGLLQAQESSSLYYTLLIFGFLNTAISIYYYLKVPFIMLIKGTNIPQIKIPEGVLLNFSLTYFSVVIILLFFFPDQISEIVRQITR
jgi:NADH-quinone oxidoreductase subunit N